MVVKLKPNLNTVITASGAALIARSIFASHHLFDWECTAAQSPDGDGGRTATVSHSSCSKRTAIIFMLGGAVAAYVKRLRELQLEIVGRSHAGTRADHLKRRSTFSSGFGLRLRGSLPRSAWSGGAFFVWRVVMNGRADVRVGGAKTRRRPSRLSAAGWDGLTVARRLPINALKAPTRHPERLSNRKGRSQGERRGQFTPKGR
jgi:hypothetical protein